MFFKYAEVNREAVGMPMSACLMFPAYCIESYLQSGGRPSWYSDHSNAGKWKMKGAVKSKFRFSRGKNALNYLRVSIRVLQKLGDLPDVFKAARDEEARLCCEMDDTAGASSLPSV